MKKYGVGYTAGAFDLFHIGHLNLLRNAKEQCDRLIVGVTVNELILEIKHHTPAIPFNERIEIVRSVRYVDEALPQTNTDKVLAWHTLKFDALFVGSDWQNSERWKDYEKQLSVIQVPIVYLKYTETTSSTLIRLALQEQTRSSEIL